MSTARQDNDEQPWPMTDGPRRRGVTATSAEGTDRAMPPPPNPKLVAAGAYDLKDREIAAAQVDAMELAIAVRREGGLLVARRAGGDPASSRIEL